MKAASTTPNSTLPRVPAQRRDRGVDWSRDDHVLAVVDSRGRETDRCTVQHTAGLRQLLDALGKHGVGEVATERPDGPVDRFDAYLLADTLRTDRARLRRRCPHRRHRWRGAAHAEPARTSSATVSSRPTSSARLRNVLPAVLGLFSRIDSAITLAFLTRLDTQDKVDWLTSKRLAHWLSKQGYSGRADVAVLHQRILATPAARPVPTAPTRPNHR